MFDIQAKKAGTIFSNYFDAKKTASILVPEITQVSIFTYK